MGILYYWISSSEIQFCTEKYALCNLLNHRENAIQLIGNMSFLVHYNAAVLNLFSFTDHLVHYYSFRGPPLNLIPTKVYSFYSPQITWWPSFTRLFLVFHAPISLLWWFQCKFHFLQISLYVFRPFSRITMRRSADYPWSANHRFENRCYNAIEERILWLDVMSLTSKWR